MCSATISRFIKNSGTYGWQLRSQIFFVSEREVQIKVWVFFRKKISKENLRLTLFHLSSEPPQATKTRSKHISLSIGIWSHHPGNIFDVACHRQLGSLGYAFGEFFCLFWFFLTSRWRRCSSCSVRKPMVIWRDRQHWHVLLKGNNKTMFFLSALHFWCVWVWIIDYLERVGNCSIVSVKAMRHIYWLIWWFI